MVFLLIYIMLSQIKLSKLLKKIYLSPDFFYFFKAYKEAIQLPINIFVTIILLLYFPWWDCETSKDRFVTISNVNQLGSWLRDTVKQSKKMGERHTYLNKLSIIILHLKAPITYDG